MRYLHFEESGGQSEWASEAECETLDGKFILAFPEKYRLKGGWRAMADDLLAVESSMAEYLDVEEGRGLASWRVCYFGRRYHSSV